MSCVYCEKGKRQKNWCAMKTESESEFIAADVTFSLSAFFAFFLPWMAEFVIIRFIIEECERKSASSEMFWRYCTHNTAIVQWIACLPRIFRYFGNASPAWLMHARRRHGFSPERLTIFPVFIFLYFFFLAIGGAADLFSSPVCSWTEMVAYSPCCGVFCSLWSRFNCSKIEFLDFPFNIRLQLVTWTNAQYFTQFPGTGTSRSSIKSEELSKGKYF